MRSAAGPDAEFDVLRLRAPQETHVRWGRCAGTGGPVMPSPCLLRPRFLYSPKPLMRSWLTLAASAALVACTTADPSEAVGASLSGSVGVLHVERSAQSDASRTTLR